MSCKLSRACFTLYSKNYPLAALRLVHGLNSSSSFASVSDTSQQHQPGGEQLHAADIDSEKCQDTLDASTTHEDAPCSDDLPMPPTIRNSETELNKSRAFASVYTWSEAAEAAAMLHVLVSV